MVAEIYDGKRSENGAEKDWDILVGCKHIQVKSHAKAETTPARFSVVKFKQTAKIDELITVVFTHDYKLKEFYRTPWENALELIKREKNRDVIYWDHQSKSKIPINELPKQELIRLFRLK